MRNFSRTEVRVGIPRIVPVDVELAVVPVRVRHIAVGVAGTEFIYTRFRQYLREFFTKSSVFPRGRAGIV